jgi:uncharacterized protein YndB with AHSA1/START domain
MSKKKKASPGKTGKKLLVKKTAKKAVKPVAKKKALKKAAPSKAKSKKPATKSLPKSKNSPKKNTLKKVAKKLISKIKALTTPKKSIKSKPVVKKDTSKKAPLKKAIKPVLKKDTAGKKHPITTKATLKPAAKILPAARPASKSNKTAPVLNGARNVHPQYGSVKDISKGGKPSAIPVNKQGAKPVAEEKNSKIEPFSKKQQAEKKSGNVLAITNTIPVNKKHEISPSKIASISYSITNPVKRTDSYAIKAEKEPTGKFELEFVVHASAEMLYEFLSTPSGLSEWFCDDLNIRNGIYTFIWDDQLQQARLLKTVELQLVRFQWVDKTDGSYFEFRIQRDDLTNDISLIITDFAETASERESSKLLWHSQVEKLMHVIGSIF